MIRVLSKDVLKLLLGNGQLSQLSQLAIVTCCAYFLSLQISSTAFLSRSS